jgi:rod shape determining protein RodA
MRKLDLPLLLTTLALTGVGLLVIYSTGGRTYLVRQLLFLPVAVGGLLAAYLIPRRVLLGLAWPFYGSMLILLVAVVFFGSGTGSHRWFMLGPVALQPSEFAKLATVVALARYLSEQRSLSFSFRSLFGPTALTLVPGILILIEPDLSSALLLGVVLAALLYTEGLRPVHILLLYSPLLSFVAGFSLYTWIPFFAVLAVIVVRRVRLGQALAALTIASLSGLLSPLSLSLLKEYQRARIHNFLAPWIDPHGVGWNAIQSRIAIGSGRLFGKGFRCGTQNRLGFLPNRHTDFAFSCIGEEFGLLGSLVVLSLHALLVGRFLQVARTARDRFSALLCVGCAAIIGYQVFVNVGMLLGLLPITGIALPFISYGGSGLLLNYTMVGLVLNVRSKPE